MSMSRERAEAASSYAVAYATHYSDRDYPAALRSYDRVIAEHPGTREAEYSRTQIHNIVRSVVPADERRMAELKLAFRYLPPEVESPTTATS